MPHALDESLPVVSWGDPLVDRIVEIDSRAPPRAPPRKRQWLESISPIGEGAFGKVYKCWDAAKFSHIPGAYNTGYAMKIIDLKKSKMTEEAWSEEIRLTQEIHGLATDNQHLDVKAVEIIDEGGDYHNDKNQKFSVQTLVQGHNMRNNMKVKGSEQHWKQAFRDIANYIYLCNKNGIYHNDIKPENVMLDRVFLSGKNETSPRAYVIDLGLASKGTNGSGSPSYVPPDETHPRDIWAFGILVSEMLLNRLFHPQQWKRITLPDRSEKLVCPTPAPLEAWRKDIQASPNISETLKDLLQDILDPEPTKRLIENKSDFKTFKQRIDAWFNKKESVPGLNKRVPVNLDESVPVNLDESIQVNEDEYIDPRYEKDHEEQGGTGTDTCFGSSCKSFFKKLGLGGGGYARRKRTRRKRTRRKRTQKTPRTRRKRTRRKRTPRTRRR